MKELLDSVPDEVKGSIMAMGALTVLRVLSDKKAKKWQRLLIELPYLACVSGLSGMVLYEMGFGVGVSSAAGGLIGHYGLHKLQDLSNRYADKWVNK